MPPVTAAVATPPARPPSTGRVRVLLVDDEPRLVEALARRLHLRTGFEITVLSDPRSVEPTLAAGAVDAVVLDLHMPHLSGQVLLERLVAAHPALPVIILTGANDVATAVACMRAGAADFCTKPVAEDHLVATLERACARAELSAENERLRARLLEPTLAHPEAFAAIVTSDPALRASFHYLEVIAPSAHPVLVTGETGTGKELVARAIHRLSRAERPFVAVNVAGLDDTMFADTLFGHKKGAFTGAEQNRPGLIESAAAGTLFLDEIGDLSLSSQVKLLRLLQEREYFALGSDQPRRADCRVVVATCRPLAQLQDPTRFRPDLFYRLRTHHIHLPPLSARPHDLGLLAAHFLANACAELDLPPAQLSPGALALLARHRFPGNCRELEAVLMDAVTRSQGGTIQPTHIRLALGQAEHPEPGPASAEEPPSTPTPAVAADPQRLIIPERFPSLKEAADQLIAEALARSGGNHTQAARMLGLTRQGLYNRLRAMAGPETGL